jgi:hypothetical protein
MTNDQLMEAISKIHELIHHETTPRFDDHGNEISDSVILDRIFAIIHPIVKAN